MAQGTETQRDRAMTEKPAKDLGIIITCYNESAMIAQTLAKITAFLNQIDRPYTITIVDDCSADDSVAVIREQQKRYSNLKLLRNPKNMGKGYSVRNGIINSDEEYIIYTDMDLVYSLENIKLILTELQNGNDIVVGNRRLKDSVYIVPNSLIKYVYRRHVVGRVFNFIVRLLFPIDVKDTQSGLKGFNKETALAIFPRINTDRFVFDVEVFILAKIQNRKIKEIPVQLTYFSQLSSVGILKYSFKALGEVLTIRKALRSGKYR